MNSARHPELLLGNEAVAAAALDAGIGAAYAYPGTPSTEILPYVQANAPSSGVVARWAANEKSAYEQALGVSLAGRRALVAMKHVGLNVAADPFVNSALLAIRGGLVVAVADDPGMHSSQNEQDSRHLADFARIPCLEPADPQQAYDMTREAFDLSERFEVPVLVRLTTRLAHGRAAVTRRAPAPPGPALSASGVDGWTLLPAFARERWRSLVGRQPALRAWSEAAAAHQLDLGPCATLGVITTGFARGLYLEARPELHPLPSHLHIGAYPLPERAIRELARQAGRLLVLEEGYPFVERAIRGVLDHGIDIAGRETGALPATGELTPESVRAALGLAPLPTQPAAEVPARPPQLCRGCPHTDSFEAVDAVRKEYPTLLATSDIGCYSLGALPPHEATDTCVCMGASIGMAQGAAEAGLWPVLAVIGDGTFLHSGLTPLMDAAATNADMTVLILDNGTIAMTGVQATVLPDDRLAPLVLAIGVDPAHVWTVPFRARRPEELTAVLRKEIAHRGLSVVIAVRECVELTKKRRHGES